MPERLQGDASRLDLRRRARLFVVACHVSAVLIVLSAAARFALEKVPAPLWWLLLGPTLGAMLAGPELLRRTHSLRSAALLPVSAGCALPLLALQGGGLNAPAIGILPAIPLIATLFVGARVALLVAVGLGAELLAVAAALHQGWVVAGPEPTGFVKAIMFGVYLLAGALIAQVHDRETRAVESRLHELARQLYDASTQDPLTGAFNRRHFAKQLSKEMAYARRHGTSVSVLTFDIDHFKQVNDSFGHSAGDRVLCEVVARLGSLMREEDILARYGGEEFVVLLRGADPRGAAAAAERLRAALAARPIEAGLERIFVTTSVGCATLVDGESADNLLSRADARLYAAKRAGRNRVVSESDDRYAPETPPLRVVTGGVVA